MKCNHRKVYKPLIHRDHHRYFQGVSHLSVTEPKKEKLREPAALSSEYHKAHKQLMFWAAILLIWELIGVDLEQAKKTGGTIGAVIGSIRNLQAVPWVLLILVAYFLFKSTVEWFQSSVHRRSMRVAQIDFGSAWLVALLSYTLYFAQEVSKVQFADIARDPAVLFALALGLVAAITPLVFFRSLIRRYFFRERSFLPLDRLDILGTAAGPVMLLFGFLLSLLTKRPFHWIFVLIGMLIGGIMNIALLLFSVITYRRMRLRFEQLEEASRRAEQQWKEQRDLSKL